MTLPLELIDIIFEYAPKYRLKKWIKKKKLNLAWLSYNPSNKAIELLKQNTEKINWKYLSANPSIFELDLEFLHGLYKIL